MYYNQSDTNKYMKTLNLSVPLDRQSIKSAYRNFVKKNHPDFFKTAENKDLASRKFKEGTKAQEYLLNYYTKINTDMQQTSTCQDNGSSNSAYESDDFNSTFTFCDEDGVVHTFGKRNKKYNNTNNGTQSHTGSKTQSNTEAKHGNQKYTETEVHNTRQPDMKVFNEIYERVFKDVLQYTKEIA